MTQKTNQQQAFCKFSDWQPHLPPEFQSLPLSSWLVRSRRATWAPYTKLLGERSAPYWRRADIVACFRRQFGRVHPTCVAALLADFEAQERNGTDQNRMRCAVDET